MADSCAQEGAEVPKMVPQPPSTTVSGSSSPIIRPATPSTSKKLRQKLGSWVRGPFSRSKSRGAEPAPPSMETAQAQNPQATSMVAQDTLLVRTESIHFKEETIDPARKVAGFKLAIAAIDIFQSVVEYTEFVIPNPVGKVLDRLTKVLEVLKQMVENEVAWKELLLTLNDHAAQFNEQLVRMNQANTTSSADSPVLAPLKDYSTALEKLTAKIILDSGLVQQNCTGDAGWEKIKRFTTAYISVDSNASQIETYRQELRDAMQMLSHRLGIYVAFTVGYISEQLGSNPAAPRRKIVAKRPPEVSPHFVARDKEWRFIVDNLVDSTEPGRKSLSITGMGGCGKTQLVSYFLKEKKNLFTHVVYVDASSKASIEADLRDWAQSRGDGHEQDEWDNALSLLAGGGWAYILDNADDTDLDLSPFLASLGDGTIIITSRNRGVLDYTQYHLPMGAMTDEEALSVLIKAGRRSSIPPEELESARTLAKELGYLALALAHAGAYCHHLSSDDGSVFAFAQYLKSFRSHRAALMKQPRPPTVDGYKLGVYTTLDLSYEKLPVPGREFLRFISNFHYSDISTEMMAAAAETRFEDPTTLLPRPDGHEASVSRLTTLLGTNRSGSEFQTITLASTLRSFSLVSTTFIEGSMFLHIHPLVQAWVRDMKSSDAQDYRIMATQILTSCSIGSNINIYRHLLPHIIEKLTDNHGSSLHVNDQVALGHVLVKMGRYSDAEVLFRDAHKSLRIIHGEDTEDTLWVTGHLASTAAAQGRYDEAEKLELEVLEKQRKILGAEHPDTILAAGNLASTYRDQGRYDEAEKLELEVLEKRRKILGAEHPHTILAAANLASTYGDQGRYDEAEKLELEVLEKQRKILGAEHPDTILAAANLASTYGDQGRYDEAEKLELEVLENHRKILGAEHPDTILAAANLASTYGDQGRYDEAEKLELEVLEKHRKILGAEHPHTILVAANLASTYRDQGRYNEAEKLELEVLEKRRKILGAEHPHTIRAAANLAATYRRQGQYDEAEKLRLEVLEKRRKILGAEHPDTIRAAANLASTYRDQGRYDEAEKLELEVLEKQRKILGAEHPHTILAAANLACTYRDQGRYDEAEKLELEVLEKQRHILGAEHPDTIRAAGNLASTYRYQGWYDEAEKLELEVLEKRRKILGAEHPDTIRAAANLAATYRHQGRYDEAQTLELEVLEKRRKILGAEHPHTIRAAASLADTYRDQGRYNEAQKLELEVLEKRRKILGEDHPDTIEAASNLASTYCSQGRLDEAEKLELRSARKGDNEAES